MNYLSTGSPNPVESQVAFGSQDLLAQFSFFVRAAPGLLYRHERVGDDRAAGLIFDAADVLTSGNGDAWGTATNGATTSVFYHMNTLSYAATIASDYNRNPTPYYDLAKSNIEWNTHAEASAGTAAISLASLAAIPTDWRDWVWSWDKC